MADKAMEGHSLGNFSGEKLSGIVVLNLGKKFFFYSASSIVIKFSFPLTPFRENVTFSIASLVRFQVNWHPNIWKICHIFLKTEIKVWTVFQPTEDISIFLHILNRFFRVYIKPHNIWFSSSQSEIGTKKGSNPKKGYPNHLTNGCRSLT